MNATVCYVIQGSVSFTATIDDMHRQKLRKNQIILNLQDLLELKVNS